MMITKVEYDGFCDDAPGGAMQGSIALIAGDTRINVSLTLPRRIEITQSRHRLLLLAEALRQTRHMPEYRSKGAIRLAPGFLPHGLSPKTA
ncbi:hypothetical protein [Pelagimonas varians]|uniref:Uncharacterized protein n=1 Tax=Pelagimonas varians TaxID=696760 RepID=A0A238KJR8_9RHOB|nr:hypothetical protein [Pelagimonas varians]PYG29456.1 hypothetical protein C8N36_1086 [Pelagimonas varians]SMX43033.1 hypothetical protein PEV8663_02584 [Pelagimonas varians]